MPRPLRYFDGETTVEVTTRTVHSRLLLRPSDVLNALIVGILARAQQRYGVAVHAVVFVSNHYHLILTIRDAQALARFMEFVNGNLAREAGRLHDWRDKFWSRRYSAIPILDDAAMVDRLQYVLSHGAKEGLVARPQDWPGVSSLDAMLDDRPMAGAWVDRTGLWYASRGANKPGPDEFAETLELHLEPLPCWAHLAAAERQRRLRRLLDDIETETAETNRAEGRVPPGPAFILSRHPHDKPRSTKNSPAPPCHTTLKALRKEFRAAFRSFLDAYLEASASFRAGKRHVAFPEGCFPPPLPFQGPVFDPAPS